MGVAHSKVVKDKPHNEEKPHNVGKTSVSSTSIPTPRSPKAEFDPRSPSTNISRTPVEFESGFTADEHDETECGEVFYSPMKGGFLKLVFDPRSPTTAFSRTPILINMSKNNLLLNSSDNIDCYSSPVAPKSKVLGFDPRSPTNDFIRTPIVVPDCPENQVITKLQNKNLEKVIQSEICTTTPTSKKGKINPKLLESSPAKRRTDAYKRKSFVGLLETNIDFTETDIDKALEDKCRIRGNNDTEELFFENEVQENANPQANEEDDDNKVVEAKHSDDNIEEKLENEDNFVLNAVIDLIVSENKEVNNVEVCEHAKDVELNEEIVTKCDNAINNDQQNEKSLEEVPKTKSAPLTPRKHIEQPKSESKSAPVTPPIVNLTADVKELDKKLTNLIYEDQDIVVCPRIVQLKDVLERSPLKNRNRHETENKKSAQKLKVSDKPRKSDFVLSKIPVYTSKNKIHCENMPPNYIERKSKSGKKTKWDNKDTTLYL